MSSATRYRAPLGVSFLGGVAVNLPWEMAQRVLYAGEAAARQGDHFVYCALAALGDGAATAVIYGAGVVLFRTPSWCCRPGWTGWLLTLGLGSLAAVLTERAALALGWWRYGPGMPIVPGLSAGLTPLLQFLLLPPIVLFLGTCRWLRKRHGERG